MQPLKRLFPISLILFAFCLFGCTQNPNIVLTIKPSEVMISLYSTVTPSQTLGTNTGESESSLNSTPPPSLTPTPFLYTIVQGDTFTSIAFQNGVKLKDLITANPNVDPNFLIIGNTITIPITGTNSSNIPVSTPIPLDIGVPVCYGISDGGQWCFTMAKNTLDYPVENVSAKIFIQTQNQPESISKTAISPLNILLSGKSIPLVAYFPPPIPAEFQTRAELISVIPVLSESNRYLNLISNNYEIGISDNKTHAFVSGEVSLSHQDQVANNFWVVAIAYDQNGIPIGFRKWEGPNPLNPGEKSSFEFYLYSLGPQIHTVDILFEAQP
jgi:LysM repeat protein